MPTATAWHEYAESSGAFKADSGDERLQLQRRSSIAWHREDSAGASLVKARLLIFMGSSRMLVNSLAPRSVGGSSTLQILVKPS